MRLLIISVLVLSAGTSLACDCDGLYQYEARLKYDTTSNLIFTGEVVAYDTINYQTRMVISELLKGVFLADTITIDATSECSKFLNLGGPWIVYARQNGNNTYYASRCGLTRSLLFEGWYVFPPNLSDRQLKRAMKAEKKERAKQAKEEIKLLRQWYSR